MDLRPFECEDLKRVSDALDIAEDAIGNYYKFSLGQWKRHRYDIKTLSTLTGDEISTHAFALLSKGARTVSPYESRTKKRDFYLICLQDHQILKALHRDKELNLLSLLVYILTHELVHIVRFSNFLKRFETSGQERDKEERFVHATSFKVLKDISIPKLDYVLDSYREHRDYSMDELRV